MSAHQAVTAFLMLIGVWNCAQPQQEEAPASSDTLVATTLQDSVAALEDVEGEFVLNRAAWEFQGDRRLFLALAQRGEEVVRPLWDCMRNTDPAAATVNGAAVPVGIVCYWVLRQTIIYEHTDASGDIDLDWPGYLEPTASMSGLLEAREAWREVIENGWYRLG